MRCLCGADTLVRSPCGCRCCCPCGCRCCCPCGCRCCCPCGCRCCCPCGCRCCCPCGCSCCCTCRSLVFIPAKNHSPGGLKKVTSGKVDAELEQVNHKIVILSAATASRTRSNCVVEGPLLPQPPQATCYFAGSLTHAVRTRQNFQAK